MKKIHIQIFLISLTIIFLGATAIYYWQGRQFTKISNSNIEENKKVVTEEIIGETAPIFEEPVLKSGVEEEKINDTDDNGVPETLIEQEYIEQPEEAIEQNIGEETKKTTEKKATEVDSVMEINSSTFPIDLYSDSSIQKFVGSEVSLLDLAYVPDDLESFSSLYITDSKGNGELRREAVGELEKLGEAFYTEFGEKIVVVSSYRSYVYQKGIKDRGCPDNLCAKAGYSEHQSGLAIDLWEATTNTQFLGKSNLKKYYEWLMENASLYGYHNSYQKGKAIDGYDIEPWHWRYVGEKFATYLVENDLTLTQYYNLQLGDEA